MFARLALASGVRVRCWPSLSKSAAATVTKCKMWRTFSTSVSLPGDQTHAAAALDSLSSTVNTGDAPKTAILMMNMGGPSEVSETEPFLHKLFTDNDIIDLGGGWLQQQIGSRVSRRRAPKVAAQYEQIGGSPIRKWTEYQGRRMCDVLDELRPESAPHRAYTAFRYVSIGSRCGCAAMSLRSWCNVVCSLRLFDFP